MTSPWKALSSSIGQKIVVALTGLALFGFLIGHLLGNMLIFVGPEVFNAYGHTLTSNPLLIPIELVLLAIFLVHIGLTIRITRANRRARPDRYAVDRRAGGASRKSTASSTMIFSGMFVAVFVVSHLKTFKYGPHYEAATAGVRDLHRLTVEIFSNGFYVAFYVVAMLILASHLRHGVSSAFQSLGADHPWATPRILLLGKIAAAGIGLGFASIPIALKLMGGSA